ncbi:MAG: response regulator [Magnetococcales bacterium]|nr:response regulator [Magnetococcales bacterium]
MMAISNRLPINMKIGLLVLLFTILGVSGVSYTSYHSAIHLIHEQINQDIIHNLSWEKADFIKSLNALHRDALLIAERAVTADLLEPEEGEQQQKNREQLNTLFATLLQFNPAYVQIRSLQVETKIQELVRVQKRADGTIFMTPESELRQKIDPTLLHQAKNLSPGEFLFSEVHLNKEFGNFTIPLTPVIQVMVPIQSRTSGYSGTIMITADFRKITESLSHPPEHIRYFLSTPVGDYLFHPEENDRFQLDFGSGHGLTSDYPSIDFLNVNASVSPVKKTEFDGSLFRTAQLSQRQESLIFTPIQMDSSKEKSTFLLGAIISQESIINRSRDYRAEVFKIGLMMAFGLSLSIALSIQALTRPIIKLTRIANRIAAGEQNIKPEVESADEVGELAKAFIKMLDRLNHSNAALRDLAASLEEKVARRTADMAKLRDQALDSSQSKSLFLTTMSHEIRTPLNVVLGILELLKDEVPPQQREYINLAYGSGRNLLTLINNVLDFSKIDANQFALDEVDFDLSELVEETAFTLAPLAHTRRIELTAMFPSGAPSAVRGDPNRLRQIFTNLLGNAIKFTPEGGTVELHGGPLGRDQDVTEYLFEVRDSGMGIPDNEKSLIFSRFVQTRTPNSYRPEGTGLGLTICKHLVELMGGEIGVDDNPYTDTGSVFHFTIFLKNQTLTENQRKKPYQLNGIKILGVDSAGLQTMQLANFLSHSNARYDSVTEIGQALTLIEQANTNQTPYHIVILNQKPGKNRRQDFKRFHNPYKNHGFIILTDLLDQSWDEATELPGATICIRKPITRSRLFSAILWILNNLTEKPEIPRISPLETKQNVKSVLSYTERILLVDDQKPNRKVGRSMLIRLGCRPDSVVTASNGKKAFELHVQEPFSLIFMDCQMPVMDGLQATEEIRKWEKAQERPPVTIIAFTANTTQKNHQAITEAGMDRLISKPVSLSDFQRQLDDFLHISTNVMAEIHSSAAISAKADETVGTQPTVDITEILETMNSIGLEEAEFREVAVMLSEQLPELINSIRRDIQSDDLESAQATAHVLKGSMVNIIFPQLQEATKHLYMAICNKKQQKLMPMLLNVDALLSPIQEALSLYIVENVTEAEQR